MKLKTVFIIYAVLFFIVFDAVSTLIAANYLGSFDYEKSNLLKIAYDAGGVYGFLLVKIVLGTVLLLALYVLSELYPKYEQHLTLVLFGVAASGLFVGLSNLNIVVNGHSIWFFGIDAGTIATITLILPVCSYTAYDTIRIKFHSAIA